MYTKIVIFGIIMRIIFISVSPFSLVECDCNEEGTINGNVCNQVTGACTCKPGRSGEKCEGKDF